VPRCPICRKNAAPRRENPFFPFCSERCKLVDLGKWLGEEYQLPGRPEEVEDETPVLPSTDEDNDGTAS
jgi:uncharacterized protein